MKPPFWTEAYRRILGLYPFQIGKGWVAYLFKDSNIPEGQVVRTREGVLVRTAPDYVFKHVYLFKEFEPVNTEIFKRIVQPGNVCIDVGANFGYYTALFAHWGARVYAFEPVPSTFALNQATLRLNHREADVKSFNLGLGDQPGSIRIYRFKNLSHGHASSCDLGRDDAVPEDCNITTLDNFCAEQGIGRIDFIKIDVEGFEHEVLKGGKTVLSKTDAPTVHFEVNAECMIQRKKDPNEIISLLRSYGYTEILQIKRYGGIKRAPATLPLANCDYIAFKNHELAQRVLNG